MEVANRVNEVAECATRPPLSVAKRSAPAARGLMEAAPEICTELVGAGAAVHPLDADHVLTLQPVEPPLSPATGGTGWVTFDVYPAEDNLLRITWMETAMRALGVLRGPLAFELCGIAELRFTYYRKISFILLSSKSVGRP